VFHCNTSLFRDDVEAAGGAGFSLGALLGLPAERARAAPAAPGAITVTSGTVVT
jgi:hypothetical protein